MKDKGTAAVLALFLGGIGIHRFYLNQALLGVLYLLFCWTFIPLILSFLDFIVFLVMSTQSFNQKYNKPNQAVVFERVQTSSSSAADEIEKLHSLLQKGAITEAEFQKKKAQLL